MPDTLVAVLLGLLGKRLLLVAHPAVHWPEEVRAALASACPLPEAFLCAPVSSPRLHRGSSPGRWVPLSPSSPGVSSHPEEVLGALSCLRTGARAFPPLKNAGRPAFSRLAPSFSRSLLCYFLRDAPTARLPITLSFTAHSKISQGQTVPVLFTI